MFAKVAILIFSGIVCASTFAGPPPPPPKHHHVEYDSTATIISAIGLIGTALIANEINKQKREEQTIIIQKPNSKKRVAYWCESSKQFFPYCRSCPEGWKEVNIPN